jgi:hypothetical protein
MVRMSVDRGMIRKVSIGKRVNISPKLASNSMGWEVQVHNEVDGWKRVAGLPIVRSRGVAEMMMQEQITSDRNRFLLDADLPTYRVYESLQFPLH